ncbi:hypothetical protein MSG28_014504 [Choristoneura fumiferana]|uniref:Uncharacterized protein n=1 Tax=Choristoneura fumiferana TaxID=7141 RepID=A0ACC0JRN5_CHOFU|nr:hypothetical protein MSG28_014504 [Choristoneura fumiferana]
MLRNKLYLYGPQDLEIPVDLNFGQHMVQKLWSYGDAVAIINADTGETLTYRDFVQQSVDVALSLTKLGVSRGDVVSICSEKCREFLPTLLGIICSGATFAPADVTCGRATILHRVNLVKPTIMFCSPDGWKNQKETLQSIDSIKTFIVFGDKSEAEGAMTFKEFLTETGDVEDFVAAPVEGWKDLAIILYSSGTTGLPKGIPLTHYNFLAFIINMLDDEAYRGLRILNTREWYYTYGMTFTLCALRAGSTIAYSPQNQCEDLLKAIQKYKLQSVQLAPATIIEMVKSSVLSKYDVSSLVRMVSASTPADAELVNNAKSKFRNLRDVCQVYGMSEVGCLCSEERSTKGTKPGSAGQPSPGSIMKVVDQNTREPLGPNQRGEICIKSPALMQEQMTVGTAIEWRPRISKRSVGRPPTRWTNGLGEAASSSWSKAASNRSNWRFMGRLMSRGYLHSSNRDHMDSEGFMLTGDIGYYDEDAYFYIVNRIKELIKFNSFQVAPAELESVLQQHPQVREAGVVGAPHEKYGQAPLAFVALQPGATITEKELVAYVDTQIVELVNVVKYVRLGWSRLHTRCTVDTQVSARMRLEGGVRFVDALPRGAGAKLDRNALKLMI